MGDIDPAIFQLRYNELLAQRDLLGEQIRAIQISLESVEERLSAFDVVLRECRDSSDDAESHLNVVSAAIHEMTLEDALAVIAERNEGFFDGYYHKTMLIDAGLLRGESQAISQKLYDALSKSDRFEKTDKRGRWRLIDADYGATALASRRQSNGAPDTVFAQTSAPEGNSDSPDLI